MIKIILLVFLFVICLFSMFVFMMLGYICVKVVMIGCKDLLFKFFNFLW